MGNEEKVYETLNQLGISYRIHEHPPVYTVAEANQYSHGITGVKCKNLFLRNKKGDQHFLVILEDSKKVDLKALSHEIGAGNISFASGDRLMKYLGLVSGSVSPFGLINDIEKHVHVILDEDFKRAEEINFHPNINTLTLTISYGDFEGFLNWCENKVTYVKI